MWFTFYRTGQKRGRFQVNYCPSWRDFLCLLRGYRLRITRESLDLTTLQPMREVIAQQRQQGRE